MIALMERKYAEPVMRKQAQTRRQGGKLVQIEQHLHNAIAQFMPYGPQPLMHHRAGIQGGDGHAAAACSRETEGRR